MKLLVVFLLALSTVVVATGKKIFVNCEIIIYNIWVLKVIIKINHYFISSLFKSAIGRNFENEIASEKDFEVTDEGTIQHSIDTRGIIENIAGSVINLSLYEILMELKLTYATENEFSI